MTNDQALEQNALLIHYSSRAWRGTKGDKDLDAAISERYGCDKDATVSKKHLVDPKELFLNAQAFGAVYNFWRLNTLAWTNAKGAPRFLTGKNYPRFMDGYDSLYRAAMDRADEFSRIYPRLIDEYKPNLAGVWKAADYPRPELIRAEFSITIRPEPLPLSPDSLNLKFLGEAELTRLRADLAGQWAQQERAAMGDLYRRLLDPVKKMAETLSIPDKIFRDSLVNNLAEVCELIPDLNFKDDPDLADLVRQVKDQLTGIDAKTLRDNVRVRKQVAGAAGNILAQITGAGARYIDMGEPDPEPAADPEPRQTGGLTPQPEPAAAIRAASPTLF